MPTLGRTESVEGLVPLGLRDSQEMSTFHRNREKERMLIPEEPEPITELSVEQRVYIYNVGPWRFQQELASYGTKTIAGLREDLVFKELSVEGPLVIDGLPKEYYPAEGEAKVMYHRPPKNRGRQSKRPGFDFAMEVIGCGMMVNPSCDLRPYGVFISEQTEQKTPEKGAPAEAFSAFKKWASDVKAAQNMLRQKCSKMCQDANIEYARGRFADVRNDQLYQAARLIQGSELQYGWLKDTGDKADNKSCWSCTTILKGHGLKCPQCGELQVSQAEFDAEKKRRADLQL